MSGSDLLRALSVLSSQQDPNCCSHRSGNAKRPYVSELSCRGTLIAIFTESLGEGPGDPGDQGPLCLFHVEDSEPVHVLQQPELCIPHIGTGGSLKPRIRMLWICKAALTQPT